MTSPSHLTLITDHVDNTPGAEPLLILTANLGLPQLLPSALRRVGWSDIPILPVDAESESHHVTSLFRADAHLALPADDDIRVAVAALVRRPGTRSAHLRVVGTFSWPRERDAALRGVESLIQSYVDQWMPTRALWPAPAETLLGDEVR